MQKYTRATQFPLSLLPTSWFAPKPHADFVVLRQMPPNQIEYYLFQAKAKNKAILIQLNQSKQCPTLREVKGHIHSLSLDNETLILRFQNIISLVDCKDIRHIQLY